MKRQVGRVASIIVCGVSGSGKSTLAAALAARLAWRLIEGDDLHPAANIAKMAAGQPLGDADRWPWLDAVGVALAAGQPAVASCSALRRCYRDRLRRSGVPLLFVYLRIDPALAAARFGQRRGHFMPAALIASQFAALEPPDADEAALCLAADAAPDAQLAAVLARLGAMP